MSSFWDGVKDVLGVVAPVLGTAVGGPLGGIAARTITRHLLGEENETDDASIAAEAIRRASPEDLLKLKQAEQDFTTRMKELDIEVERLHAGDRDSARQREIKTGDRMPAVIALAALFGFFGILAAMIFVEIPESAEQPLAVMLGALGTLVTSIGAYYFGSSKGSSDKNAMIARLSGADRASASRPTGRDSSQGA